MVNGFFTYGPVQCQQGKFKGNRANSKKIWTSSFLTNFEDYIVKNNKTIIFYCLKTVCLLCVIGNKWGIVHR